ncbi:acyl carrier protein [Streptomyces europaeiscabiei]|uniref:acyl carrier protein n=1 Tax=Streptomyces europaeiscabiei TaxID=146819 RepID=UPI0029B31E73|nr:acyl carrier protein [Streptomyces europaeiscabiei]MDX2525287.1 acyl carrier protein [Streptomyces europaeiscabiei]
MERIPAETVSQAAAQGDDALTHAVIHSVATLLDQEVTSISPQTRLFEDLALDSTGVLELLMQLEDDLGTEFDPETLEPADFETVESLVAYAAKQAEA